VINTAPHITYFNESEIAGITLPERFTYPFYYEPHPLAKIAAGNLQAYLEANNNLGHNFKAIGKMFGVLVVQDTDGKTGYLWAFSGKLADSNHHTRFVPPVFDMLEDNSFFLKEQLVLNHINQTIEELEANADYLDLKHQSNIFSKQSEAEISAFKHWIKRNKNVRKLLREKRKNTLNSADYQAYEAYMVKHSLYEKHKFRQLTEKWQKVLDDNASVLKDFDAKIESLKTERKEKSAVLQQQLFEQYVFINKDKKPKSLHEIFSATVFGKPPAAAGECATPKLLQYAFINGYKPLAMAEFWWGAGPRSEVRKHGNFYPACSGKCKPILGHMLQGIVLDDNPLLVNTGETKKIDIIFEDDHIVVVNKPEGLLSVPGITIQDSVYTRLQAMWTDADPLIIHRLDMATSGLLVVAKTKEAHKHIQKQFLNRTVTKRYTALLSKVLVEDGGEINLPLRGDLDNRPMQLVCFEHGKKAITKWQAIERTETTTKVNFWPLTGRTHQLRIHAAHSLGLNAPIVGDDLYGTSAERLYLHAAELEFTHPVTGERLKFEVKEGF
jgi:tRNA pseudouridine32 synthase / 23S rRNA pseudouridine746 synthase